MLVLFVSDISLSIMFSGFINVLLCIKISFLFFYVNIGYINIYFACSSWRNQGNIQPL